MTYIFIPVGLIAIFALYLIYLLVRKDTARLKIVLFPGLFFIFLWAAIYFVFLK